ncbi:MAG: DUF222 domain-containing protein, partial [Streptosporangiaceae bacterium]
CELAGHLAAAMYRFLLLVGDFDARQGRASWDQPSCSAWLAWKCQVAPGTAREHVRVARALRDLPAIGAEFAAGRMSYAKVRARTRIGTPETEAGLADLAGPMTAAQLERFAAAHRKVSRAEDERAREMRRVSWRTEEDGQLTMTVRLPAVDGAVLLQALRAAADDVEHPHTERPHSHAAGDGEGPAGQEGSAGRAESAESAAASLADALVQVAGAYLSGKVAAAANPDIYQVVVHVGTDVFASTDVLASTDVFASTEGASRDRRVGHPADPARCHLQDGPAISPATAQRIACQATWSWMLHDHQGNVLDVGRRHRRPPPALRRAVRERDGYRCQYPGCNSRRVDIHHIVPWASGGNTRLRDLISYCEAHHVIVHESGTASPGLTTVDSSSAVRTARWSRPARSFPAAAVTLRPAMTLRSRQTRSSRPRWATSSTCIRPSGLASQMLALPPRSGTQRSRR